MAVAREDLGAPPVCPLAHHQFVQRISSNSIRGFATRSHSVFVAAYFQIFRAEQSDCYTHLIGLVTVLAPLLLARQGDAGGVEDDEITDVRHRGWLWKDSQLREGRVCGMVRQCTRLWLAPRALELFRGPLAQTSVTWRVRWQNCWIVL